jgi:gamma-glutamylaminecyclotransferase
LPGVRASSLLFVYGSLKRGRANHHELHGAEYVSEARTAPCFALRVVCGYPALVSGSRAISGELFRIATSSLSGLDAFEGDRYERREILLAGGERALAYLSSDPEAGEPYPADEWPTPRV